MSAYSKEAVVNGATRLIGTVGHPIAQVKSPTLWSGLAREHGLNLLGIPFHVLPADLPRFFDGMRAMRNLDGMIVTIPHKIAARQLVDEVTERSRLAGSVNLVAIREDGRLVGDITDGYGMIANLRGKGVEPRGMRTLLVGAGGVGTAIAFALAGAGVSELVIYDTDTARAEDIARRVAAIGTAARVGPPDPDGFALVVNATPLGMRPDDPPPVDPARLSPDAVVADVVVHSTPLLEAAAARGCRAYDGVGMTVHQFEAMAAHLGFTSHDFSPATVGRVAERLGL